MNILHLAPNTIAWLKTQVQRGHFASYEQAVDYSVKLTRLRESVYAAVADPLRLQSGDLRKRLQSYMAAHANESNT